MWILSTQLSEKSVNPQTYHRLKLGYASTVYKSQGKTLAQVYVLHDGATNNRTNYVALSRQTDSLQIFVNRQETRSEQHLVYQMSREQEKSLSIRYLTEEQVNRAKTLGEGYWDAAKEIWTDLKTNIQNKLTDLFHENKEFYEFRREESRGPQRVVEVDSSSLKSQILKETEELSTGLKDTLAQERQQEKEQPSIQTLTQGEENNRSYGRTQEPIKSEVEETQHWTPLFPVPENAPEPHIDYNRYLFPIAKDRQITAIHEYKDHNGDLLGYVVRLEEQKEKNKITPILTYCENEKGQQEWQWQDFGERNPLYGQEKLVKYPTKPVLVVEGENTADSAQKLFPDHVVISWPGGAGEVERTNWGPLLGRNVTVLPDQTPAGLVAAQHIEDTLKDINDTYRFEVDVRTVDLPKDLAGTLVEDLLKNFSPRDLQSIIHKSHKEQDQQKDLNLEQILKPQQINDPRMHDYLREHYHHKVVPDKPAHEIEAMKFSERFNAYHLDSYRDEITKEQKTQFEKEVSSFMKNEKAVNYLKSIDADMVKSLQQMHREVERAHVKDFDLDL